MHIAVPGRTMEFGFMMESPFEWGWREFLADLTDDSLDTVLRGPRGRGIIGCWVSPQPGCLDFNRITQMKKQRDLPIYAFQVVRADGSCIYLHSSSNNKVSGCTLDVDDEVELYRVDKTVPFRKNVDFQSPVKLSFRS